MKLHQSKQINRALTLVETVVVISIIAVLLALLLPALAAAKKKSCRISCANNVKQVLLAFRIWSGDHLDKYPAQVSVAAGGAMEPALKGDAAAIFQVMSNELSTPKVLLCWDDPKHFFATNFSAGFSASNISYFAGVAASSNSPAILLSGDDNFEMSGTPVKPGILALGADAPFGWTRERHVSTSKHWFTSTKTGYGYIGLGDGSVHTVTDSGFANLLQQTGVATNYLAIP